VSQRHGLVQAFASAGHPVLSRRDGFSRLDDMFYFVKMVYIQ
jgi:hypothetical protein